MALISSCAIYARLVYVAFLYNFITNDNILLSETQISGACPPAADPIACALNTLNMTGATGDPLQYHYAFGIHYTIVGINDPLCVARMMPDCARDLISGSDARETCGYIVTDTTTHNDDGFTRDVTVVGIDESLMFSMTYAFGDRAGSSSSYGSRSTGDQAGMTLDTKLLIAIIFLVGLTLGAFAAKWVITCILNRSNRSTDATRYLS